MDRTTAFGFGTDATGRRCFLNQDLAAGVDGTDADAGFFNTFVEEFISGLIEFAGLVPSAADSTQVRQALQTLFNATAAYPSTNTGIIRLPGGIILQSATAQVPAGSGLTTTLVTLPVAFPNNNLDATIAFLGNTPPGGSGAISVQPANNAQVSVTTNYTSGPSLLGVVIKSTGN